MMIKLIKLTCYRTGEPLWLNAYQIVSIHKGQIISQIDKNDPVYGSCITTTGGDFLVVQSTAKVLQNIRENNEQS